MLYNFEGVTIGTRLRIREDLSTSQEYDDINVAEEMEDHRGEIVFVTSIDTRLPGTIYVGTSCNLESSFNDGTDDPDWIYYVWTPSMFECIIDEDVSLLDMLKEECV